MLEFQLTPSDAAMQHLSRFLNVVVILDDGKLNDRRDAVELPQAVALKSKMSRCLVVEV